MADTEIFMEDLAAAMNALLVEDNEAKRARLVGKVLRLGTHDDEAEVVDDLEKYAQRITSYNIVNNPRGLGRPLTTYGYARLDAFGRIYNRVLEHVMSAGQLRALLSDILTPDELAAVTQATDQVMSSDDRGWVADRYFLGDGGLVKVTERLVNITTGSSSGQKDACFHAGVLREIVVLRCAQ